LAQALSSPEAAADSNPIEIGLDSGGSCNGLLFGNGFYSACAQMETKGGNGGSGTAPVEYVLVRVFAVWSQLWDGS
jgi:hypothetical protein